MIISTRIFCYIIDINMGMRFQRPDSESWIHNALDEKFNLRSFSANIFLHLLLTYNFLLRYLAITFCFFIKLVLSSMLWYLLVIKLTNTTITREVTTVNLHSSIFTMFISFCFRYIAFGYAANMTTKTVY